MIGVTVLGAERVVANLARARTESRAQSRQQLMRAGLLIQRELRARVSKPGGQHPFWGRQAGVGATMTGRSGKTRQRIAVGPVLEIGNTASVAVGSPDPHVAFQERGGVVHGRRYLRIPTAAAQTAAGVDINQGRSVRGLPGYFVMRSKAGRLWIARDLGKGGGIELMYLLKEQVQIRARNIFANTKAQAEPQITQMFGGAVTQVVRVANG